MSYSYGGRKGFGFNQNQPVEVNKEYEARIEDISRRGDGIAKIEGFIFLFVYDITRTLYQIIQEKASTVTNWLVRSYELGEEMK